jgi:D-xylose transport system ATP-binding protein
MSTMNDAMNDATDDPMGTPLVSMHGVSKAFGGVHAVEDASLAVHPGEVLALLGHNGAGKSTLMKILAGACTHDAGTIRVGGEAVDIRKPTDAQALGLETIHQTLALADNLDAVANLFLGRELLTRFGMLDDEAMESACRAVLHRLNPNFRNLRVPVRALSGGQRQVVAIARALQFDARVLIMDEPCAALGPEETRMVHDLIRTLQKQGVGIILITHDMPDVFSLSDRLCVMKNGRVVGTYHTADVDEEAVLGMIIAGRLPPGATPCTRMPEEAPSGR